MLHNFIDQLPAFIEKNERETGEYYQISEYIFTFQLYQANIDWKELVHFLVTDQGGNNIAMLNRLLNNKPELVDFCIKELSTPNNTKQATKIIDRFNLDIKNYPKILEFLETNTINFYLRRGDGQSMALWKVEDL